MGLNHGVSSSPSSEAVLSSDEGGRTEPGGATATLGSRTTESERRGETESSGASPGTSLLGQMFCREAAATCRPVVALRLSKTEGCQPLLWYFRT